MRREVLWRSVRRFLDPGEELLDVAYMWRRHRLLVPIVVVAALLGGGGAALAGFEAAAAVAVALGAIAVAASVATEYRVLALTSAGLVLLSGGRIRQVATGLIERLPDSTVVERVANNLVISDWRVGADRYSVLRRFESTMSAFAATFPR